MSLRYKNYPDNKISDEFEEESVVQDDNLDDYDPDNCSVCGVLLPESLICLQCGTDNRDKKQ